MVHQTLLSWVGLVSKAWMLFLCPLGAQGRSNAGLAGLQLTLAMFWLVVSLKGKELNQIEEKGKDVWTG